MVYQLRDVRAGPGTGDDAGDGEEGAGGGREAVRLREQFRAQLERERRAWKVRSAVGQGLGSRPRQRTRPKPRQ